MFIHREDGATEVFGELLIVAVTIILAAIIVAFMTGLIGHTPKAKVVLATAEQTAADTIQISYQGGEAHDSLYYISVVAPNGDRYFTSEKGFVLYDESTPRKPNVGEVFVLKKDSGENWDGRDHVVVVANYYGESQAQVILDTMV